MWYMGNCANFVNIELLRLDKLIEIFGLKCWKLICEKIVIAIFVLMQLDVFITLAISSRYMYPLMVC